VQSALLHWWRCSSVVDLVLLQEAGLKVKEYELLRKNFSDGGNFGGHLHQCIMLNMPSSSSNLSQAAHVQYAFDLGIKYDPSTGIYGECQQSENCHWWPPPRWL
jgi:hypothetical protein